MLIGLKNINLLDWLAKAKRHIILSQNIFLDKFS